MSFFGLFGNSEDNSNRMLREHLKKCAGLGQRPPPFNCCDTSDPCADRTGCAKREGEDDDEEACPEPERVTLVPYVPKCTVPPTIGFSCPEGVCEPPKPDPKRCCPRAKIEGSNNKDPICKKPKESEDHKKKRCGAKDQSGCGNSSCEPRPLHM